jgi:hypothetical protein
VHGGRSLLYKKVLMDHVHGSGRAMQKRRFTILGVALALFYWIAESLIHRFIYFDEVFEIMPSDRNELWMRIVVVVLFVGFGTFADNRARKIRKTEAEKHEVFQATVRSSQHILNNLLNQMQLALYDSDGRPGLESETRELLSRSIREGKQQVECLSSVTEMDSKAIEESVRP